MPRVNRDLQRRLAARRERERRRPTERRYRFASAEPQDAELAANGADGGASTEAGTQTVERPSRTARSDVARQSRAASPPTRTFAEYAAEYAYVVRDLRRVAAVVGSLLVVLIVLYFVLPH
jgi:hypothetical protein